MNKLNEIRNFLDSIEEDFRKFYVKTNQSAGTKVRKHMQELKKKANEIRSEIQEMRKQKTKKNN